ncbi:MAG TPA: hypothetical protein VEX15_10130 [Nocardioidaceae bacterium]|nr:hypothetical protein [Nocardioidaceae bacterium]
MNRLRGLWIWSTIAVVVILVGIVWMWPTPPPSSSSANEAADSGRRIEPNLFVGPPHQGGGHHEEQWTSRPWRPVAEGFARDFADPGRGVADWRRRVGRWVTDYLAEQYRHTAAYRIPVGRLDAVDGPRRASQAVTATASYRTGLTLILRLEVFPATGWKVTRVTPVDATAGM